MPQVEVADVPRGVHPGRGQLEPLVLDALELVARDEDVRPLAVAEDVRRGIPCDEGVGVGDDGVGAGLG